MLQSFLLVAIGVVTGACSGLFGIGGGVVLVPALVILFGLGQHAASGTSLVAMFSPVGLLSAFQYYRAGKIGVEHLKIGGLIAVGMLLGAVLGARLSTTIAEASMRRAFAVFLAFIAVRMWIVNR